MFRSTAFLTGTAAVALAVPAAAVPAASPAAAVAPSAAVSTSSVTAPRSPSAIEGRTAKRVPGRMLILKVTGAPKGAVVRVRVKGPDGYRRTVRVHPVKRLKRLKRLKPGTYRISTRAGSSTAPVAYTVTPRKVHVGMKRGALVMLWYQVRPLISAGSAHTCALRSGGAVKCWGGNRAKPVTVPGISTAIAVSAGGPDACALLAGGTIKCWSHDDISGEPSKPVRVSGISTATAVTTGRQYSCALLTGGTIRCWGGNSEGQLGNGSTNDSASPVRVSGISTATAVTAGESHSCALLTGGDVKCWGGNREGQLGNGTTTEFSATPVLVSGIFTATAIDAGSSYSCAPLAGGTIECWGANHGGQLGNGTRTGSARPVQVWGISTATAVTAGYQHSCALLAGGTIKCWGRNGHGELGNGTTHRSTSPVRRVSGIQTATAITAGWWYSCALLTGSTIKCWGVNFSGQLGNGTLAESTTPVKVIGLRR